MLLAFIILAGTVQHGGTRSLDNRILETIRSLADRGEGRVWGEESVIAITSLGSIFVLVGFSCVVAGALLLHGKTHACLFLVGTLAGALLLNYTLKSFFGRPRPEVVTHVQRVASPSFPSGHALISTAVYGTLGAIGANMVRSMAMKLYLLCLAVTVPLLVGASRVYLGVHFPTDVLAGWMIGLLWTIVCWLGVRALQRRGEIERPG